MDIVMTDLLAVIAERDQARKLAVENGEALDAARVELAEAEARAQANFDALEEARGEVSMLREKLAARTARLEGLASRWHERAQELGEGIDDLAGARAVCVAQASIATLSDCAEQLEHELAVTVLRPDAVSEKQEPLLTFTVDVDPHGNISMHARAGADDPQLIELAGKCSKALASALNFRLSDEQVDKAMAQRTVG